MHQKNHVRFKQLSFNALGSLVVILSGTLSGCQLVKPEPTPHVNIGANFSQPSQYGLDIKKWQTDGWKIALPSDHLPKGEWWQIFSG
nr:hypothetical protein [Acinetobacter seifertii]